MPQPLTARVKWFDNRWGFGFLVLDDRREVFVHYSAISGSGHRALRPGQIVTCDVREAPGGLQATAVDVSARAS